MIRVGKNAQPKLLGYVHELLQVMKLDDTGGVSWSASFDFDIRLEILVSNTKIRDIQDNKKLARELTRSALLALRSQDVLRPSWEDFIMELTRAITRYLDKPLADYRVLIPFHARGSWINRKRWLTILGVRLRKFNWHRVQELTDWDRFWRESEARFMLQRRWDDLGSLWDFVPLLADAQARTYQEAFDRAGAGN